MPACEEVAGRQLEGQQLLHLLGQRVAVTAAVGAARTAAAAADAVAAAVAAAGEGAGGCEVGRQGVNPRVAVQGQVAHPGCSQMHSRLLGKLLA